MLQHTSSQVTVKTITQSLFKKINRGTITIVIIYMKKILDSDWSTAVQLICNSVQKSVIPCRNL